MKSHILVLVKEYIGYPINSFCPLNCNYIMIIDYVLNSLRIRPKFKIVNRIITESIKGS